MIEQILFRLFGALEAVTSPTLVAVLGSVAVMAVWIALTPARGAKDVENRLSSYGKEDVIESREMRESFAQRVIRPMALGVLRFFARLLPHRAAAETERTLLYAGRPGNLTALDFWGLRLLLAAVLGGALLVSMVRTQPIPTAALYGVGGAAAGFMLPYLWLRSRVKSRQRAILKAIPNALDMLSIGVTAGLGFESSMIKVSEQWDNELTRELRLTTLEIQVGASRDAALTHLAQRTGVPDLNTFVAVLVQSSQLGVSIADVLNQQAATMREKRRQRAETQARQAAIKMLFPLVFFIFPAMFIVILGPSLPRIMEALGGM